MTTVWRTGEFYINSFLNYNDGIDTTDWDVQVDTAVDSDGGFHALTGLCYLSAIITQVSSCFEFLDSLAY